MTPVAGHVFEANKMVEARHTAAAVADGALPAVLSTPHLIGWIETTAHEAIAAELKPGQASVGTLVHLAHLAATPVGMPVRIRVELLEVNGRKLRYKVEAWDTIEKIAEGEHERFIIDIERFTQNVAKKL